MNGDAVGGEERVSYSSVVEIGHALCGEGGEGRGGRENESWGSVSGKCLYTTGKLHTSNNTVNTKQVYLTHTVTLICTIWAIQHISRKIGPNMNTSLYF